MSDDQERLVANALRAQATSSGVHVVPTLPTSSTPEETRAPSVPAAWVLLLALLLGLAAGAVAAVITLR
jgi:hypothetical protein